MGLQWSPALHRSKATQGSPAIAAMFDQTREGMSVRQEKAILVSMSTPDRPWLSETDPCDEIRGLADTAGAKVVGMVLQKRRDVISGTYIGKGKVAELAEAVRATVRIDDGALTVDDGLVGDADITVRADGQRLFDGCLPTLIEWGDTHPAATMPESGVTL